MRAFRSISALLVLWTGAAAQDAPLEILVTENPTLRGAEVEAEAARADLRAARGQRLPQLRLEAQAGTVDETFTILGESLSATRDPANAAAILEQALFTSGRVAGEVDAARGRLGAARGRALTVRQDVVIAGATALAELVRARAALEERELAERVLTDRLAETKARRGAGLATRTDLSQSEARLADAVADRIAAEGDMRLALASHARLFASAPPQDSVLPPVPSGLPATLDDALGVAMAESPAVAVRLAEEEAARGEARAARGRLLPQVALSGQAAYVEDERFGLELGEAEQYGVFVRARWDVFSGGSGYARASAAKRRERAARLSVEAERRAVREGIVAAWTAIATAKAELVARERQAEAARRARDGVAAEQSKGLRTRLDLLDAERELSDARVSVTAARRDLIVGQYRLAGLLGLL